jgi:hypothetical protein
MEAGVGGRGVLEPDRLEPVAGEQGQSGRHPSGHQPRLPAGGQPRPQGGQQHGRGQEPVGDEGERRDLGDRVADEHERGAPHGGHGHHGQLPAVGADPAPGAEHEVLLGWSGRWRARRPDDPTAWDRRPGGGRLQGRRGWPGGRQARARGRRRLPGPARRGRRPGLDPSAAPPGLHRRPGRHPHGRGHPLVRDRPGRRAGAAGHHGAAGPARDGPGRAGADHRHLRHRPGPGDRRQPTRGPRLAPVRPGRRRPVGGPVWANGRIDLPGQQRQVDWRWHCAPLEEWDGLNPAGRR